ncbi:MAG: sulfurtransferase TusA family protein [Deltaproteobacteria bacterium]|nr:sulfurtransferase TusA family protein [Deltaproteobacteria bacterium]
MTKSVVIFLDTVGLKCPKPILKIAIKVAELKPNDILEVAGDCPTFEHDVRDWCKRLKKKIVSVSNENGTKKRIQILL